MSTADGRFWTFSLEVYGRPGVAPACLALQDRHGLDVNLLLFCCWAASRGVRLDQRAIAGAEAAVAGWRNQVVKPLRSLRRRLKREIAGFPDADLAALRERVLAVELEGERLAQGRLESLLPSAEAGSETGLVLAVRALRLYFRLEGVDPDDVDDRDCQALLAGTFPEASQAAISAALSG
ncbi:MAG: hypothetical protein BroJett029_29880 [Alphaproteobacteria bacterium]|nr:MAG: hypothetical protein BroJett029_29880 [Alphaproteobacteria bacterium]